MKRDIYKWGIVLVCIIKIIKVFVGVVYETPYLIKDMVTFILSSAMIIAFLFIKSDKFFTFAIIGLLISNILEYVVVYLPVTRIPLGVFNLLALFLTFYFAIKSTHYVQAQ